MTPRGAGVLYARTTPAAAAVGLDEIELTLQERSGTEGFQQILKPSSL